jgi:hypothetical protein
MSYDKASFGVWSGVQAAFHLLSTAAVRYYYLAERYLRFPFLDVITFSFFLVWLRLGGMMNEEDYRHWSCVAGKRDV